MFSPASNSPMLANSGLNNPGDLDGGGTINPASLNPTNAFTPHLAAGPHHMPFSPPATATATDFHPDAAKPRALDAAQAATISPRGLKRSRSPDPALAPADFGAGTLSLVVFISSLTSPPPH